MSCEDNLNALEERTFMEERHNADQAIWTEMNEKIKKYELELKDLRSFYQQGATVENTINTCPVFLLF